MIHLIIQKLPFSTMQNSYWQTLVRMIKYKHIQNNSVEKDGFPPAPYREIRQLKRIGKGEWLTALELHGKKRRYDERTVLLNRRATMADGLRYRPEETRSITLLREQGGTAFLIRPWFWQEFSVGIRGFLFWRRKCFGYLSESKAFSVSPQIERLNRIMAGVFLFPPGLFCIVSIRAKSVDGSCLLYTFYNVYCWCLSFCRKLLR